MQNCSTNSQQVSRIQTSFTHTDQFHAYRPVSRIQTSFTHTDQFHAYRPVSRRPRQCYLARAMLFAGENLSQNVKKIKAKRHSYGRQQSSYIYIPIFLHIFRTPLQFLFILFILFIYFYIASARQKLIVFVGVIRTHNLSIDRLVFYH